MTVNGTSIYFRGIKILTAIIDHLLSNGMDSAESVILTGCSGSPYSVLFWYDNIVKHF